MGITNIGHEENSGKATNVYIRRIDENGAKRPIFAIACDKNTPGAIELFNSKGEPYYVIGGNCLENAAVFGVYEQKGFAGKGMEVSIGMRMADDNNEPKTYFLRVPVIRHDGRANMQAMRFLDALAKADFNEPFIITIREVHHKAGEVMNKKTGDTWKSNGGTTYISAYQMGFVDENNPKGWIAPDNIDQQPIKYIDGDKVCFATSMADVPQGAVPQYDTAWAEKLVREKIAAVMERIKTKNDVKNDDNVFGDDEPSNRMRA